MSKNRISRKAKKTSNLNDDAQKIRREMEKKVYRREDGILQCPPAYAIGYGAQDLKIK